jgi:hypothetical protein
MAVSNGGSPQPDGDMRMTPDQRARASAALDVWFEDGSPAGFPGRGRAWEQSQLEGMHAALEAPDTDAALEAFPGAPGTWLTTPEQDAENRELMGQIRQLLGLEAGSEAQADREAEL